jgi:hypothetical protein
VDFLNISFYEHERNSKRFLQFHFTTIALATVFGDRAFHPETTFRPKRALVSIGQ